jgi:serine/threonine protein kinase
MLGGSYMVGRKLGQGGFSICYRGWDGDQLVAIKELFPRDVARRYRDGRIVVDREHGEGFEKAIRSIVHEAEVLAEFDTSDDPTIVKVHNVLVANDTVYMVMDHLDGQSYAQYVRDREEAGRGLVAPKDAVGALLVMLGALESLHERGLLHLDIKPQNVFVRSQGSIMLIDFGSARAAFVTEEGIYYGNTFTPGYAAPEQHIGEGLLTPATDVYGAGAFLHFALTSCAPRRADERRSDILDPPIASINPAVRADLEAIVLKAMALDPNGRYQTVSLFRAALKQWLDQQRPPLPKPLPLPEKRIGARTRFAVALLDMVAALWLLALTAMIDLTSGALIWAIPIWGLVQLAPLVTGATPGMALTGLRLIGAEDELKFPMLFARALMLIVGAVTFRWKVDADGTMYHDRLSQTRVVRKTGELGPTEAQAS